MRSVTFRTARFESRTPKPHYINPNCFGDDLVAWLIPGLKAAGLSPGEPVQEDYGWGVWVDMHGDPYWIAASSIDDEVDGGERPGLPRAPTADPAEWGIIINYEPGFRLWRRLTHRPKPEDLATICSAIDAHLRTEPEIREIAWWDGEPFRGQSREHP